LHGPRIADKSEFLKWMCDGWLEIGFSKDVFRMEASDFCTGLFGESESTVPLLRLGGSQGSSPFRLTSPSLTPAVLQRSSRPDKLVVIDHLERLFPKNGTTVEEKLRGQQALISYLNRNFEGGHEDKLANGSRRPLLTIVFDHTCEWLEQWLQQRKLGSFLPLVFIHRIFGHRTEFRYRE
jgi:hypothetical protein